MELSVYQSGKTTPTETAHCEIHGIDYQKSDLFFRGKFEGACPECIRVADEKLRSAMETRKSEEKLKKLEDHRKARIASSGLPKRFVDRTLANYLVNSPKQREALEMTTEYVNNIDALRSGRSLVMSGTVGVGKTHLAAAIVNSVIKIENNTCAIYVTARDMIRCVRGTWGMRDGSEISVIERYATTPMLVIDEIGVQYGTDSEMISMFEIIDKRYGNQLPTVFISNLPLKEMTALLGDRIIDRLREDGSVILNMNWPSYRGAA